MAVVMLFYLTANLIKKFRYGYRLTFYSSLPKTFLLCVTFDRSNALRLQKFFPFADATALNNYRCHILTYLFTHSTKIQFLLGIS